MRVLIILVLAFVACDNPDEVIKPDAQVCNFSPTLERIAECRLLCSGDELCSGSIPPSPDPRPGRTPCEYECASECSMGNWCPRE